MTASCCMILSAVSNAQSNESEASADLRDLDRIIVIGTRTAKRQFEVPASTSLVTSEDIAQKGATEAAETLRGVPGIFFRRAEDGDNFVSFNIRGLPGNHGNDMTLALVDGIPFMTAHEEVLFSEIPFAAVEQVEVVRGPTSALYGRGGLGGAINYLLRSPSGEQSLDMGLAGGSYGYGKATLGWNATLSDNTRYCSMPTPRAAMAGAITAIVKSAMSSSRAKPVWPRISV